MVYVYFVRATTAAFAAVFICLRRLSSALNVARAYEVMGYFDGAFFAAPLAARATRVRACYNLRRFCAVLRTVFRFIFGGYEKDEKRY